MPSLGMSSLGKTNSDAIRLISENKMKWAKQKRKSMRVVRPHWAVGMRERGSSVKRDSCSDCPDFFCSIRCCMNMEVFAKPGQFSCLGEEIDREDSGGGS